MSTLADVYAVERVSTHQFLLTPRVSDPRSGVLLVAEESAVDERLQSLRSDALHALGPVGGDATGRIAAAGLLAIHIEEELEKHPSALAIVVTATELRVEEGGGTNETSLVN